MIEFIYKNLRDTEYSLQAKEHTCKKMSHTILNNDVNNKGKKNSQPQVNWSASIGVILTK